MKNCRDEMKPKAKVAATTKDVYLSWGDDRATVEKDICGGVCGWDKLPSN